MKYEELYLTTYFHESDKGNNDNYACQVDVHFMSEDK